MRKLGENAVWRVGCDGSTYGRDMSTVMALHTRDASSYRDASPRKRDMATVMDLHIGDGCTNTFCDGSTYA